MEEFEQNENGEKEIPVEAEKLFEFEEWDLKGEWLRISTQDGKIVEGAYYQSENGGNEVVIFHPGLPGDGVKRFEENFVGGLLAQGYDVFVARHNGLKNQEDNQDLFHNKHRVDLNENVQGDALTWFDEPRVAISYFAHQHKPITMITQSFSGITAANSFIEMSNDSDSNLAQNVKKWILASASIWGLGKDGMLDPERNFSTEDLLKYCQFFAKKYEMPAEGPEKLLEKIRATLGSIDSQIGDSVPGSTEVVGVYPVNDKLVSPQIGINFIGKLPRGIMLRDNHIPVDENEDPHDFKHAGVGDLIRIIKMKTSKSKHVFDINK